MKMRIISRCITLVFASGIALFSQTTPVLVSAGYSVPTPPQVAPGQVLVLYSRAFGLAEGGIPRSGRAEPPLPTTLAELSMQLTQGNSLCKVPIIEVSQSDTCGPGFSGPACVLTSVKAQIPFEVDPTTVRDAQSGSVALAPTAQLVLYAESRAVATTSPQPVPDNAHVLTTCDAEEDNQASNSCDRVAFHGDGTPVNAGSPTSSNETITVRVYGLGQTSPAATTGAAAQPGYVLTDVLGSPRVRASLTPFVNAIASASWQGSSPVLDETPATITAGGLEGGSVGIYQLSVALPKGLSPVVPCGGSVRSNYVLNVITSQGVELIPMCIGQ
jgi:uncharacterized protein (TIGR03437 family)